MKDWPAAGIQVSRDIKLQSTAKKTGGGGSMILRCFCLFLCMAGTLLTIKEAFGLEIKEGPVYSAAAISCLVLGISHGKGGRWKYLFYVWNFFAFLVCLFRWKTIISGYFAVENGIRNQLGEYYDMNLAQRKLPVEGETGIWFLILVFVLLVGVFGNLVVRKGRIALLALVQILIFSLELLCGCTFQGVGIYLIMCSMLVLFAMGNRRGGRNQRILYGIGIRAGSLILILMLVSGIFIGPILFEKADQFNQKLYDAIQQATTRMSQIIQSQNGIFGDHTPTADGSLNNYRVDQDEEVDLRITVSEKPENSLYLRGFIGDTYEGTYWHRIDREDFEQAFSEKDADYQVQNILYHYIEKQAGAEKNTAIVERVRPGGEYGYVPYGFETPKDSNLVGDSYYSSAEDRMQYSGYVNWKNWLGSQGASEEGSEVESRYREYVADQYLKIPVEGLDRLKEYCAQWDFHTVQEVIDFVVPTVKEGRPYSMELEPVPKGQDFAEYFFFEQKKGYCIHYATTAALMFRMMGVPARYVTGYVISANAFSETKDGFAAEIPDSQAHAWVEVYRSGKGWIPVEVTPGYGETTGQNGTAERPQPTPGQEEPTTVPVTTTPEPQVTEPGKPQEQEVQQQESTEGETRQNVSTEEKSASGKILFCLAAMTAAAAVCAGLIYANRRRVLNRRNRLFMQKNRNKAICEISYGLYRLLWDAEIREDVTQDVKYAGNIEERLDILEKGEYAAFIKIVQQAAYGQEQLTVEQHQECLAFYHKIAVYLWQRMAKRKKFWWKYMKCYEIS